MNAAINLQVQQNSENFLSSSGTVSVTGRTLFHVVSYHGGKLAQQNHKSSYTLKIYTALVPTHLCLEEMPVE